MENQGSVTILHVVNDLAGWQLCSDESTWLSPGGGRWPNDRVLREAALDLSRFIEPQLHALKQLPTVHKRVVMGAAPVEIVNVAAEETIDLIVMSPRRNARWRRAFWGSVADRVTRLSPCPVLSVTPPLPSRPWRGKLRPAFFGWPAPREAAV
jgi:nucleotide-binding universal stress UspA family protein